MQALGMRWPGVRFELEEGSQEFSVLKTIYELLQKKGDAEKLYSNFYRDIAANATRYFKTTKVAEYDTVLEGREVNSIAAELNDKQKAGLQYIGWYVLQNLFKKHPF